MPIAHPTRETQTTFIAPREFPDPPCRVPAAAPAPGPEAIAGLLDLCRAGRIYAVETWIRAGKPIWLDAGAKRPGRPPQTPLGIAIETGQYDLTVLLLANGYPISTVDDFFFESLLWDRKFAYFDLLVAWGVDILRASPGTILDTYSLALFDRYEAAGGDLTRGHALGRMLGGHSSNRPAYGWAKRHNAEPRIARELAVALGIAIRKGSERTVALLLWAGADPRIPAPYVDPDFTDGPGRTSPKKKTMSAARRSPMPSSAARGNSSPGSSLTPRETISRRCGAR